MHKYIFRHIYICEYIYMYAYMYTHTHICTCMDRKKPHPPTEFSIYYVPWSRAVCKRLIVEIWPSHLVVKSCPHSSWSGNIVHRKPPLGGGCFFGSMCDKTCSHVWYHMCDMMHSHVWHYVCDMIHSHVRHDSFICFTWLVQMCDIPCVTRFIHMCDMAHTHVWHGSFTCVTWLIHMCDMTRSYVWRDSRHMSHLQMSHDSPLSVAGS